MTVQAGIEPVRLIERLAHRNALTVKFRDVHLDEPVTDGLAVRVVVAQSDRSFPAVRTTSGVYTVRSLPGLGPWQTRAVDESGLEEQVTVRPFPVTVDVRDELRRFLPCVIKALLPRDTLLGLDVGSPPSSLSPLSPPAGEDAAIPLYSAPTRPVPAGMAVVRASLVTPAGAPAAYAALEVFPEDGVEPVRGVADERGQLAVLLRYPAPRRRLGSPPTATKQSLASSTWNVGLQAYLPRLPPGTPPQLELLVDQRPATLSSVFPPPEIHYGQECVLRSSATHAELIVGS